MVAWNRAFRHDCGILRRPVKRVRHGDGDGGTDDHDEDEDKECAEREMIDEYVSSSSLSSSSSCSGLVVVAVPSSY